MRGPLQGLITFCALGMLAAVPVSGYYHYVHYLTRGAPYALAQEKFDLTALPSKTVTFFVSDGGPNIFPQDDSFASVLSQLRQAARTWNSVDSSDLRVAFGGLYAPGTAASNIAGGQVVFEELPPFLLGYGGPTTQGGPVTNANGTLVPIVRGVIHLTNDLTKKPGPSYTEGFLLTAVHEMGHALGLQHTFTSSAMSTAATRATSLTRPIDADDIAGISVLYPTSNFSAQTGSIAGRVLSSGAGVHMASVVAIRNGSAAVSALTNPDGSYRIDGVPPGQYYVYTHPLPPQSTPACQDICPPYDVTGNTVAPGKPFNTVFYGNTIDYTKAQTVSVVAGALTDGVSFNVTPRTDVPLFGVSIYSFFNNNPVSPGYLNMAPSGYGGVLAGGTGLTSNGNATPGLKLQVMGGAASVYNVQPYTDQNGTSYLNLAISYNLGAPTGPEHLIFTSATGYLYVLPSGLNLVQRAPPFVSSVSPNADGSVAITGTGFAPDSAIYFDGLPTAIRVLDDQNGRAVVIPPPGASGQHATVSVFNHDGQNSLFLQSTAPQTYAYPVNDAPGFSITPNALPAGSEAAIVVTGVNTRFAAGQTIVGFGTSDVFVRDVFVLSPTQLLVNVSVPAQAMQGTTEVSTVAGFQTATLANGFTIQPPRVSPSAIPKLQNAVPGQTGAYPGAVVTLHGSDLAVGNRTPTVVIGDQAVQLVSSSPDQLTLQLPTSIAAGPVLLRVNNGTDTGFPVAVAIDSAPARIVSAVNATGVTIDSVNTAHNGDLVGLRMSGFGDTGTVIFPTEVSVVVGGISNAAIEVVPVDGGLFEVRFVLSNLVPTGAQVPVTVYLDGRSSLASTLAISK